MGALTAALETVGALSCCRQGGLSPAGSSLESSHSELMNATPLSQGFIQTSQPSMTGYRTSHRTQTDYEGIKKYHHRTVFHYLLGELLQLVMSLVEEGRGIILVGIFVFFIVVV